MNVKYIGNAKDYSGYGEANRHDIASLLSVGVGVTGKFPQFTPELSDFGALGELVLGTEGREMPYDTIILHTTPNVYQKYMEIGKYHIARVFWETDKLPEDFAKNIELCQEVWTGSEYNKQAIRNAGVTKPIYIIPQSIVLNADVESIRPYKITHEKKYKFYSIFEWTERKNPLVLFEAFWLEFANEDGVSLTIKTYVDNFSKTKRLEIDSSIKQLKKRLNLVQYPPIYLYRNLMDRMQVYRFHKTFDCFISTHRGEGWGIPQVEAMLLGKPVISTNCGGVHEYLTDKKDALLLPYSLVPLKENTRNNHWYTTDQNWASVDVEEVRKVMRTAFSQQTYMQDIAQAGTSTVREKFGLERVGAIMKNRLEQITI